MEFPCIFTLFRTTQTHRIIQINWKSVKSELLSITTFKESNNHSLHPQHKQREMAESYGFQGVPSKPDSGEMAPSELGLNDVPTVLEGVTDSNCVVASTPVVLGPFVFGRVVTAIARILLQFILH